MTFVVELRELKKNLPRPLTHFWRRFSAILWQLRVKLALVGLLCLALDWPIGARQASSSGGLPGLCSVLTAAVSATLGLLGDASVGLCALFRTDFGPLSLLGQRLSLCLGEPVFAFDGCSEAGAFPMFSGYYLAALGACAFFLFGCGLGRRRTARHVKDR